LPANGKLMYLIGPHLNRPVGRPPPERHPSEDR
jgi:hypothetical protein